MYHQRVGNAGLLAHAVHQQNALHHNVERPDAARDRRGHAKSAEGEHCQTGPHVEVVGFGKTEEGQVVHQKIHAPGKHGVEQKQALVLQLQHAEHPRQQAFHEHDALIEKRILPQPLQVAKQRVAHHKQQPPGNDGRDEQWRPVASQRVVAPAKNLLGHEVPERIEIEQQHGAQ